MRSNLPFILSRIPQNLAESGTPVLLSWREWSAVSFLNLVSGGSGYVSATVAFTGASDTPATGLATVVAGAVTALTLTNPGVGYAGAPPVQISGTAGTPAVATAQLYRDDPVTNSRLGTSVAKTETLNAFLHFVQIATSGVRIFNEMEVGDCIADFAPEAVLDGRDGLTFTIDGQLWVPKLIGDKLARTWDVVAAGERLYRSVLLRKAS